MNTYTQAIDEVKQGSGALLDAIRAVQKVDGRMTEAGVDALAEAFAVPASQVYETASFYSMIRFAVDGKNVIEVCKNAPCHVAGAREVVAALEKALGIEMGGTTPDGRVTLRYTECIGQCQAAPAVLVNGVLHERMRVGGIDEVLQALA